MKLLFLVLLFLFLTGCNTTINEQQYAPKSDKIYLTAQRTYNGFKNLNLHNKRFLKHVIKRQALKLYYDDDYTLNDFKYNFSNIKIRSTESNQKILFNDIKKEILTDVNYFNNKIDTFQYLFYLQKMIK